MSDTKRETEFDIVVIISLYNTVMDSGRMKTKARLKGRLIEYCRDNSLDYDKVALNLAVSLRDVTPDFGSFCL